MTPTIKQYLVAWNTRSLSWWFSNSSKKKVQDLTDEELAQAIEDIPGLDKRIRPLWEHILDLELKQRLTK